MACVSEKQSWCSVSIPRKESRSSTEKAIKAPKIATKLLESLARQLNCTGPQVGD